MRKVSFQNQPPLTRNDSPTMGTPGSVEMVQFFSSLVFWESISSTYPGLSPVACLSKLPQGAILEICETFDQSDDLAWPDTLFPNRETAMLSGSMLNTLNSLKHIWMKGEGGKGAAGREILDFKFVTLATAPTWRGTSPVPHSLHSILPAGSHIC